MSFIFPTDPNIGDLVTNPSSGQIFRWNGFAWGGDSANSLLTASFAFTASYLLGDGGTSVSASYADTASYAFYAVSASHEIVHELSSSYADTASFYEEKDTLQSITTRGNHTSRSIVITGSLSQGMSNIASGIASHAEGMLSNAAGNYSHAEGGVTFAFGVFAHTEGNQTTATSYAHAEGNQAKALGVYSHAEGTTTTTVGNGSHAEGQNTTAKADWSHAEGLGTISSKSHQHVEGQYNLEDANAIWVVGDGASNASRSNLIAAYTDKLTVTGSLIAPTITGSLQGTASFANNASNTLSASYVLLEQIAANGNYGNDALAAAAGIPIGGLYRNGNFVQIRIS